MMRQSDLCVVIIKKIWVVAYLSLLWKWYCPIGTS